MRSSSHCSIRRGGFTLCEILIVVLVIAILAMCVIQRLVIANEQARAATYWTNLYMLEDALEQFRADCGVYPWTLTDLNATSVSEDSAAVSIATSRFSGWNNNDFDGPYLTLVNGISTGDLPITLPRNPYIDNSQVSNQTIAAHWNYLAAPDGADYSLTGTVMPPAELMASACGITTPKFVRSHH